MGVEKPTKGAEGKMQMKKLMLNADSCIYQSIYCKVPIGSSKGNEMLSGL